MHNSFFQRIGIRAKLLLAFASLIVLSVVLIIVSFFSINTILYFQQTKEHADQILFYTEEMELAVKELMHEEYKQAYFYTKNKSNSFERFENALISARQLLKQTEQSTQLEVNLQSLEKSVRSLRTLLQDRGFRDYGLEGSLREAIHALENSDVPYDKATMLTLRRHEKDFFLRKDLKYHESFEKVIVLFRETILDEQLLTFLKTYQNEFTNVVAVEREIGLDENTGLRGTINTHFDQLKPEVQSLSTNIKSISNAKIETAQWWLIITFSIQLIIALILAISYANLITKPVKEIRSALVSLSKGKFPSKLSVKTSEELGQAKASLNELLERLQSATEFAKQLGEGKLNTVYDIRYHDDVLAQGLMAMQKKLKDAHDQQQIANWTNEGMALFNEVLSEADKDALKFAQKLVHFITTYLQANQAALYFLNHDEYVLDRMATYAYGKKRFVDQRLSAHSGLLGQCVQEQDTILLTQIPKDYVKITSGLGEATPRNVAIIPLKDHDRITGVLELASFHTFKDYEISFLEKIAQQAGGFIQSIRIIEDSVSV